jgi:hypothetical protein
MSACDLKTAADRLNWQDAYARGEEPRFLPAHVYRMVIGMSIESLLKGILVAHKVAILDENGKLRKDFTTHNLSSLARKIDSTQFTFSEDEMRVLKETEPYIRWAGKYPFGKSADEGMAKTHSSIDMEIENRLWDRLYEHLANVGWLMKAGERVPLRPKD